MKRSVAFLVIPPIIFLLFLIIYPTGYLFYMAFHKQHPARDPSPIFVGLGNFVTLATDWETQRSILTTLLLTGATIPIQLILGILLAILFTEKNTRGKLGLKVLLLIPMVLPPLIIGTNWRMLFFAEGPLNHLFVSLGLPTQAWLSKPFGSAHLVVLTVAALDVWQWTPFIALAVISGIESLPEEVYEAAMLDGASEMKVIRHIILPMIKGIISVVILLRIVDSLKIFDIVYSMTYGGPGLVTTTLPFHIFKTGFTFYASNAGFGYCSLLSLIFMLVATISTMVFTKFIRIEKLIWE